MEIIARAYRNAEIFIAMRWYKLHGRSGFLAVAKSSISFYLNSCRTDQIQIAFMRRVERTNEDYIITYNPVAHILIYTYTQLQLKLQL